MDVLPLTSFYITFKNNIDNNPNSEDLFKDDPDDDESVRQYKREMRKRAADSHSTAIHTRQAVLYTAIHLLKRYYLNVSSVRCSPFSAITIAALLLAAKIEGRTMPCADALELARTVPLIDESAIIRSDCADPDEVLDWSTLPKVLSSSYDKSTDRAKLICQWELELVRGLQASIFVKTHLDKLYIILGTLAHKGLPEWTGLPTFPLGKCKLGSDQHNTINEVLVNIRARAMEYCELLLLTDAVLIYEPVSIALAGVVEAIATVGHVIVSRTEAITLLASYLANHEPEDTINGRVYEALRIVYFFYEPHPQCSLSNEELINRSPPFPLPPEILARSSPGQPLTRGVFFSLLKEAWKVKNPFTQPGTKLYRTKTKIENASHEERMTNFLYRKCSQDQDFLDISKSEITVSMNVAGTSHLSRSSDGSNLHGISGD